MKLDIVTLPNNELRQECQKVENFDEELEVLVRNMFETLRISSGIGLAGPQVNVSKKVFIVLIDDEIERVFINPEIVETSADLVPFEEGCLSVPGVFAEVLIPSKITVYAQDLKGKRFKVEADNILARVIQHENDHLNGKLFIDRVSEEEKEELLCQYNKKQEKKNRKGKIFHGRKK